MIRSETFKFNSWGCWVTGAGPIPSLVVGIQLSWAVFQKLASTIGLQAKSEILEDLVQVS